MNKKFIYIVIGFLFIILIGGVSLFYFKNKPSEYSVNNQITNISEITTSTQIEENFYTIEEVAQHNSKESCWTVIRGEVYDLTQWIDKHPGGEDKILALCGKDSTQAFEKKHGGQEKPEKTLEQFEIGKLKQ